MASQAHRLCWPPLQKGRADAKPPARSLGDQARERRFSSRAQPAATETAWPLHCSSLLDENCG
eukprot:8741247-Pyramimonas_sp.AAC.1